MKRQARLSCSKRLSGESPSVIAKKVDETAIGFIIGKRLMIVPKMSVQKCDTTDECIKILKTNYMREI